MVSDQQKADSSDLSKEPNSQTVNDNNSRASLGHQVIAKTTAPVPLTNDTEKSTNALSNGNSDIPQLNERLKSSDDSKSIVYTTNLNESKIKSPSISSNNHEVIINNDCENTKKRKADTCISLDDSSDEDGSIKTNGRVVKKVKTCFTKSLTNGTSKKSSVASIDCDYGSDNSLEIDEPEEIDINSGDENDKQSSEKLSSVKSATNTDASKGTTAKTNNSGRDPSSESDFSSAASSGKKNIKEKIEAHFGRSYPELQMECTSETLSEHQKNAFNIYSKDFKKLLDILQSSIPMVCRNIAVLNCLNIFMGVLIKMLNLTIFCCIMFIYYMQFCFSQLVVGAAGDEVVGDQVVICSHATQARPVSPMLLLILYQEVGCLAVTHRV